MGNLQTAKLRTGKRVLCRPSVRTCSPGITQSTAANVKSVEMEIKVQFMGVMQLLYYTILCTGREVNRRLWDTAGWKCAIAMIRYSQVILPIADMGRKVGEIMK